MSESRYGYAWLELSPAGVFDNFVDLRDETYRLEAVCPQLCRR